MVQTVARFALVPVLQLATSSGVLQGWRGPGSAWGGAGAVLWSRWTKPAGRRVLLRPWSELEVTALGALDPAEMWMKHGESFPIIGLLLLLVQKVEVLSGAVLSDGGRAN